MSNGTDYSLKEIFDEFKDATGDSLKRIEGKVDQTAKDVADLRVENARHAGKMAVLMVVLGAAASAVGAIVSAVVLKGV